MTRFPDDTFRMECLTENDESNTNIYALVESMYIDSIRDSTQLSGGKYQSNESDALSLV